MRQMEDTSLAVEGNSSEMVMVTWPEEIVVMT